MQDSSPVSHDELQQLLQRAAAQGSAGEAHGLLAGVVCAGGKPEPDQWQAHLLGEDNPSAADEVREQLMTLYTDVQCRLNDDSFSFELLLPADEVPLSVRTETLSQWCGGFLYGLALGGFREDTELPGNVGEVMKDFYEISHARFAYETTDDADEAAYMEIVEYVRMSVLLLHEELQPLPANARLQ